jgi:hypothetical protein
MGEKIILDKWVALFSFLSYCSTEKHNVGFTPNGRSMLDFLTIILLVLSVSMRSSPRIRSKLRCPTRGRSDRFSTYCHTPKPLPVLFVALTKELSLMEGNSASHVIEVRWRRQVPQGCFSVPKKALVLEYCLSPLVGRHWRGDWLAINLVAPSCY